METPMTFGLTYGILSEDRFSESGSAGMATTLELPGMTERYPQFEIGKDIVRDHSKIEWQGISWVSLEIFPELIDTEQIKAEWPIIQGPQNIPPEFAHSEQIFEAIQSLYLSDKRPRDRQIADRIITLYRDAIAEDERILSASLHQFTKFFLMHPDLGLPRITLTPDGTLRARWIQGAGSFTAIEFTGGQIAKLVAEIPRECRVTAKCFSVEPINNIRSFADKIGASFICEI
jgi:hypothetical protein